VNLVERIIARAAGVGAVEPGEIVVIDVDRVYLQDGNTPTVKRLFEQHGFERAFDPERIGVFFDHAVLAPDAAMAERLREARAFAAQHGFQVFPPGRGISHVVAMEEGWFEPGGVVVGADSHTCTGGALQCLALGLGASDVVAAMVSGETWVKVPETAWIKVIGTPSAAARPKDLALAVLAELGSDLLLYRAVHWCGPSIEGLSTDESATLANLGVELGAKCTFLPPGPGRESLEPLEPSADTPPDRVHVFDAEGLPPFVALPHLPSKGVPLDECAGERVDQVFIGSCTNGRLEDLREAARALRDAPVASGVQCTVTPGSDWVYRQLLAEGDIDSFVAAGAIVTPPGCGPCVGTQGPIPAVGDHVIATSSRNFRGRMGNPDASVFLASPLVAARAAALGKIPSVDDLSSAND
jgi:3-isopropylmalate/(R)-2-methylmalate dehydratase large subunit